MNAKKRLLATAYLENNDAISTTVKGFVGKNILRRAIQVLLAGSVLASGVAAAALQDHGPSDPNLTWPSWYRDSNGLAIGLCKSTTAMCFPAAPDPTGFAGNIGAEMFYNMVEFKNKATGSDFQYHYLAGLEASYLPVGKPVHGTEVVFARVRMSFNFNTAAKEGTYTITHPFGKEVFENVKATTTTNITGAKAAIFFTVDVPLGPEMNFDLALGGAMGPFITWDNMPAGGLTGPTVGEKFVGDPAVVHTFTGSPFGNNFLRIDGPVNSNLDGLGHDFIEAYEANVIGQLWTDPIAQNLAIDQAVMSRSENINSIDVWATSAAGQKLIMTGNNMPSLQMFPNGATPGKYHGHVEYSANQAVPNSIKVTNFTSVPVVSKSVGLKDSIEISKATYNSKSGEVLIVAQSTDELTNPTLVVQGIPGVPSAAGVMPAVSGIMKHAACPASVNNPIDVCFAYILPAKYEVPESVSVASSEAGTHADHLFSIVGGPQNQSIAPSVNDFSFTASSSGSTVLSDMGKTLPLDALIIDQPVNGTVALVGGIWGFTANPGSLDGADGFTYVRQTADLNVSKVATGNLLLAFNPTAPIAKADEYALSSKAPLTAKKLFILANDKPASANKVDVINPATSSVKIVIPPTKGILVQNSDGTVTYTPSAVAATTGTKTVDSFTYTVKNSSTPALESNPVTVQLAQFGALEAVGVNTVKYTIASKRWVINGTTNWFSPNLVATTASCWTGAATVPTASTLIGTVVIAATGGFTIDSLTGPQGVDKGAIKCATSNGGVGAGVTAAK